MITTSYYLFLFLLIFSPWAFGTVDTLPQMLTQAACFGALFLYSVAHLLPDSTKRVCQLPGVTPMLVLLGFILLQTIPLPMGLLKILSPAVSELYLNPQGARTLTWAPLSVNSSATFTQFFHYASFAACYILAGYLMRDRARCRQVILLLIVVGTVVATQGILQYWFDNGRLLWLRLPPLKGTDFKGAFVNRNQFAAYLEMLAPLALAFFLLQQPLMKAAVTFRQRCLDLFNDPHNHSRFLLGLSAALMMAACFISLSRGAMLAVSLSSFFLLISLKQNQKKGAFVLYIFIVFLGLFSIISYSGWDPILLRFQLQNHDLYQLSSGRLEIWRQILPLVKDFLFFGSGLGTFSNIFTTYSTSSIYPGYFLYHPHNIYLETVSDLGLVGFFFVSCFFISVIHSSFAGLKKRRDPFARCLFLAAVASLLAQLFHLTFEYNLQSGAVGLTFFTVLALLVCGGHTRFHGQGPASSLPRAGVSLNLVMVIASGLLLSGSLYWNISTLRADTTLPGPVTWNRNTPQIELEKIHDKAVAASRIMPLHSYYHYAQAETAALLGRNDEASEQYSRAIQLNPAQPAYLERFGVFLADCGQNQQAKQFFTKAILHDRANAKRYERYGNWLLTIGEQEQALKVFGQAMQVNPGGSSAIIQRLVEAGFTPQDIVSILPERVQPYLSMAGYFEKDKQIKEAENLFSHALDLVSSEPKTASSYFMAPFHFYQRQHLTEKAVKMLERGLVTLPNDVQLHLEMAKIYEQQGEIKRANEFYQKVIALKPGHLEAVKRLNSMQSRELENGRPGE